jgi:general secretion pathway protein G
MVARKRRGVARGGFTLLEVLVVVAIIVVLAGVATPLLLGRLDQAKIDAAKIDCKTLSDTVETYKVRYGEYPASLEVLTQPQADGTDPYLPAKALIDPWKRPYQYSPQGQHNALLRKPDVWSLGPPDKNVEIGNW